jgi:Spy/CpxP family protein refolding chaperone
MIRIAMLLALCCTPLGAAAQTAHPYGGMQTRAIKALSPSQVDDLRAGRGMGLALAAELNGYPGPLHVIELADKLKLSPPQRERAQALFAAMKAETVPLGEAVIAQEVELDRLFASRTVTPVSLSATTQQIGTAQGALRAAHLKYHLAMLEVLTPDQVKAYAQLRGYAGAMPSHHGGHRN